ncbi:T9SS type A sorting domain-containing protein [Paracrocinitomix mangrovi]|uniref:T9SS type A sorting domain-containing protein n=1 Tax=Paracrocinitomix mangrovi TaxID=2862509 RepID=UPI001C8ED99C|nr:T9SS type A sorting domain-containing protein [Paracrocinitomix mangrovi]UKN01169.1 T9SS type A sorting domain-containing protein [Paracrocinitomix mangrovi]
MPNIVKGFNCLIIILFCAHFSRGQVLMDHPYSLWDGSENEEIHAVYEDTLFDIYFLGGTISSVGGVLSPHNIFCLNRSDLTINWDYTHMFDPMGYGEINSIAIHRESYMVSAMPEPYEEHVTRIYFAGQFSSTISISEPHIIEKFVDTTNKYGSTGFVQDLWSPQVYGEDHNDQLGNSKRWAAHDIEIIEDTILFVGKFNFDSTQVFGHLKNAIAFDINNNWVPGIFDLDSNGYNDEYFGINPHFSGGSIHSDTTRNGAWKIQKYGDKLFIAGDHSRHFNQSGYLYAYDLQGHKLPENQFNLEYGSQNCTSIWDFEIIELADTFIVFGRNNIDTASEYVIKMDGSEYTNGGTNTYPFDMSGYPHQGAPSYPGMHDFAHRNNKLYGLGRIDHLYPDHIKIYDMNQSFPIVPDTIRVSNYVQYYNFQIHGTLKSWHLGGPGANGVGLEMSAFPAYDELHVVGNILILSHYYLGWADGHQVPGGLAMWCLEPDDPKFFLDFDTTICHGDTVKYSIPKTEYAEGYEWSYSGTGIDFIEDAFGDTSFYETDSLFVNILFLENFTPGVLSVHPYTTCGGFTYNSEKVYSNNVIEINIGTNPLPNAVAGNDTVVNCFNNGVVLHGHSDTSNVSYEWNQINNQLFLNFQGQDYVASDEDGYVLRVENQFGCLQFDTVFVTMDTVKPNFNSIPSAILGCDDTLQVIGECINGTDTTSWWKKFGYPDTLNNPIYISSPGEYWFYTQFASNGCVDSISVNISESPLIPNIEISNYTIPSLGTPLTYLTCDSTSLTLTTFSDTANTTISWVDQDTLNPIGPTLTVLDSGLYYIHVINNSNNCQNFQTIIIGLDTAAPLVPTIIPPSSVLNCSNDSLLLDGTTGGLNTLEWTGGMISPSSNPLTIFDPGYYILTATSTLNGCTSSDSILIIQDNSIDVIASNDTVGCAGDPVNLSSTYVGNITGINYLWSNGTTGSGATYTAGSDSIAIVQISGDGGCVGQDTVYIDIPPYPAMSIQAYAPCGTPNSGYLVLNPISGWGPYEFSIDGGANFQTSSTIGGLGLGTHTVTVKDSLGCWYDFPAELTESAAPPTPDFLLSTDNYETDTIAIVNISSPMPDSVVWVFPSSFVIVDLNDTMPIVVLPDTGSFPVTLEGYYGQCIGANTKLINVTEFDTTIATYYNQNGIKSMSLYPNPNAGAFTVDIEFYTKQNVNLSITDVTGTVYHPVEFFDTDLISYQFDMNPALVNGTYVLRIAAEFDSAYITFVLNR